MYRKCGKGNTTFVKKDGDRTYIARAILVDTAVEDYTDLNRFTVYGSTTKLWIWLKLHRSMEAAVVAFMNPSAGMDEFIGNWELRIAIDGQPIEKKLFSVNC